MSVQEFSIGWWNTSCNHYGSSCNNIDVDKIFDQIEMLLPKCELLFLGEFTQTTMLSKLLAASYVSRNDKTLGVLDLYDKANRTEHKNCLIYNRSIFRPDADLSFSSKFKPLSLNDEKEYRVGQRLLLPVQNFPAEMVVFVSHWGASYDKKNISKTDAAYELKRAVKEECSQSRLVICIGDYNAEPYEQDMLFLGGTRSYEYATKKDALFNPAWEMLRDKDGSLNIASEEYLSHLIMVDQALVNRKVLEFFEVEFEVMRCFKVRGIGKHYPIRLNLRRKS